jgi:hypothetical protein
MNNSKFTEETGIPLNEEVEEQIPVKKYKIENGKVSTAIELETVKTTYIEVKPQKIRCKDGEHVFRVVDGSKGLFKCENCGFHRQVYPSVYQYDQTTGALINKRTLKRI